MSVPPATVAHITIAALLLLSLTISPVLGQVTPYAIGVIALAIFAITAAKRHLAASYDSYTARAFLAVFVVLGVVFSASANPLNAINFIMLPLFGPLAQLFGRQAGPNNGKQVATLATLGVIAGLAMLMWIGLTTTATRLSGFNIGPIVLSSTLIALGFVGSGGVLVVPGWRGLLFTVGPVLAIAATMLTGSRGPLLAVPFLMLFSLIYVGLARFPGHKALVATGLAVIAAGLAVFLLLAGTRSAGLLDAAWQVTSGAAVTDNSIRIRLLLYDAAWQAFLQQPIIGHGWSDIMDAVRPFLATEDQIHASLPHLHNDLLDFAVAGGIPGVVAYLAILTAPLVGALRTERDSQRSFRIYAISVLTVTYGIAGLTNLMFGFEFRTTLFVMLAAILLGYCRDAAPAG